MVICLSYNLLLSTGFLLLIIIPVLYYLVNKRLNYLTGFIINHKGLHAKPCPGTAPAFYFYIDILSIILGEKKKINDAVISFTGSYRLQSYELVF